MGGWPGLTRFLRSIFTLAALFSLAETTAFAQGSPMGGPQGPEQRGTPASGLPMVMPVTLLVNIRESKGMPLAGSATVKLSGVSGLHVTAQSQHGASAMFPNVRAGEYDLELESAGYKPAMEHASVASGDSICTVYVYMHPISESLPVNAAPRKASTTSQLQTEINKGFEKMRLQQLEPARSHLENAAKIAPDNPDVQYLLGTLEFAQQHDDLARTKFESAISISPTHERALVALGELQLRSGQPDQAARNLEKTYQANGADWRTHLLLALAYSGQKQYEKAQSHAVRAAELNGGRSAAPQLLLGQILAAEGKIDAAKGAFVTVIRNFPTDTAARDAKAALTGLDTVAIVAAEKSAAVAEISPPAPVTIPAIPLDARPWAPPDVDTREYLVAPDVVCSQDAVLRRTQARTSKQLANLEKFSAMERIDHQDVAYDGDPGPVKSRDFTYLVFIQHPKKGSLFIDEQRDGGQNLESFPTAIASTGLVAFGVFLFTPDYESDFTYKCEGLGEWRGQAAWQIRFEQRKETPSRLFTWKNGHGVFPVPIKGRVWVAANTYDVMHVETDLREPVAPLELLRNHLVIDYGPVQFSHANTSLWLPEFAELYMELHAKRYHHRHTLTHYELFSVDTNYTVAPPAEN
jgi:tetratricopeptide (TPR) repeat protein